MTTLQLFEYGGREVRTELIDNEPWFVAADVCDYFGVTNRNRVMQGVDPEDKGGTQIDTPGGKQTLTIVNESGLYAILFALHPTKARGVDQSVIDERTELVRKFKRWVTHEVLPAIRKTGSYSAVRELTFEEKMLEVMGTLNERVEAQRAQLAIAAPKAEAFDAFLSAAGDYDVRDAAQLLHREHGIEIGRTRLFKYLRANQWLDKNSRPYQNRIDQGLLRIKASTFKFTRTNGEEHLAAPQVRITPKGLDRLRAELKESAA